MLDCPDTRALAEFYRDLLGWEITSIDPDDGWINVSDGGPVKLAFQLAPGHRPPRRPDPESDMQILFYSACKLAAS